jgi:hypothetical protein
MGEGVVIDLFSEGSKSPHLGGFRGALESVLREKEPVVVAQPAV